MSGQVIGFPCPKCGGPMDVVQTDSYADHVERRRRCSARCGGYRHTIERDRDASDIEVMRKAMRELANEFARVIAALDRIGFTPMQEFSDLVERARSL